MNQESAAFPTDSILQLPFRATPGGATFSAVINAIYSSFYNDSTYSQARGKVGMTTILITFQLQNSYLLDPCDEQAWRKPCTKREKLHLTQHLLLLCH